MKLCHLLVAAVMCVPICASATTIAPNQYAPGNKPKLSAIKPDLSNQGTGQGVAILAALVNNDGTLTNGTGVTTITANDYFSFEVDFNRDVSTCFYSVTPFGSTTVAPYAQPKSGNSNGVLVYSYVNSSGPPQHIPFYLTVFCNR